MFHRFSQILLLFLSLVTMLGPSVTLLVSSDDSIAISIDSGWEEEPGETDPLPDTDKLIPTFLYAEIISYCLYTAKLNSSEPLFLDTFERKILAPPPEFRPI
ncbi:MAG: hypothetical protein RLZZ241_265 [Bacteroidota bacterium]|jgi:hypothetical protein